MHTLEESVSLDGVEKDVIGLIEMSWSHARVRPRKCNRSSRMCNTRMWVVQDDRLFLSGMTGRFEVTGAPILAEWVTATIALRDGQSVDVLELERGRIKRRRQMSYADWMVGHSPQVQPLRYAAAATAAALVLLGLAVLV